LKSAKPVMTGARGGRSWNWPEYRRDYDLGCNLHNQDICHCWNWPEYRRDYDVCLTWADNSPFTSLELTWIQKGLRRRERRPAPLRLPPRWNWPEYRRDYDWLLFSCFLLCPLVGIDLNTEGITTFLLCHLAALKLIVGIDLNTEGITTD